MISEDDYNDVEKQTLAQFLNTAYVLGLNPGEAVVIAQPPFRDMGLADPHPLAWLWLDDEIRARVGQPAMTFDRRSRC